MNKIDLLKKRRIRRKRIIRKTIHGTNTRPRLSVFKSNRYLYLQAIDDDKGTTIASCSSFNLDSKARKLNKATAKKVGEIMAKKLLENKIQTVVFDRNGFLFSGRIKSLADGARSAGLKF
jgi:large subunit ribosomal protein L18